MEEKWELLKKQVVIMAISRLPPGWASASAGAFVGASAGAAALSGWNRGR